jgi:hypothetical protein
MKESIIEGTWDEIASHADDLRRFPKLKLIVPEEPEDTDVPVTPNQKMLDILAELRDRQKGRRYTSSADTDRLLREARAGGMYGLTPNLDD